MSRLVGVLSFLALRRRMFVFETGYCRERRMICQSYLIEEGLEMTITVLLMTIMTGQNHTVKLAEYDTPTGL